LLASLKAELLTTCGLTLQPRISAAYIAEEFRDGDFEAQRVTAGIPEQVLGITVCNIPVGSAGFVKAYLKRK